jgi:hypothetical protein
LFATPKVTSETAGSTLHCVDPSLLGSNTPLTLSCSGGGSVKWSALEWSAGSVLPLNGNIRNRRSREIRRQCVSEGGIAHRRSDSATPCIAPSCPTPASSHGERGVHRIESAVRLHFEVKPVRLHGS